MSSIREQIIALIQGELNHGDTVLLLQNLAQSPDDCRFLLDELALSKHLNRTLNTVFPDVATDQNIWDAIGKSDMLFAVSAPNTPLPKIKQSFRTLWLWLGGGMILMLLGGLIWMSSWAPLGKEQKNLEQVSGVDKNGTPALSPSITREGMFERSLPDSVSQSTILLLQHRITELEVAIQHYRAAQDSDVAIIKVPRDEGIRMLEFDGVDDYIVESDSDSKIIPGQSFTVEAYVRPGSLKNDQQWIFAYTTVNKGTNILFGFDNGRVRLTTYDRQSISNNVVSFLPLFPGIWYHVVGVQDREKNTLQVFINGRLEGEAAISQTDPAHVGGTVYLGGWKTDEALPPAGPFHGFIRELRFWNRALDQEEITSELGQWQRTPSKGLAAYWPLLGKIDRGGILGGEGSTHVNGKAKWYLVKDPILIVPDK